MSTATLSLGLPHMNSCIYGSYCFLYAQLTMSNENIIKKEKKKTITPFIQSDFSDFDN